MSDSEPRVTEVSEWDDDDDDVQHGRVDEEEAQPGSDDPWSEHWRGDAQTTQEDEEAASRMDVPPGLLTDGQAHVLQQRQGLARQMAEVERFRNANCHFWRFFDGAETVYRRDHLQKTYQHLLQVVAQMPERHREQFTPRRREIIERVIADDSDKDAQDFLLLSFMCTLRGMYELFVLHPEQHAQHGIRVTNVDALKHFWTQTLAREMEAFRSGGYGNAEAPLTERLVAFVRQMRAELFFTMGAPVPPDKDIEQRIANVHAARREYHERKRAAEELHQALVPHGDTHGTL